MIRMTSFLPVIVFQRLRFAVVFAFTFCNLSYGNAQCPAVFEENPGVPFLSYYCDRFSFSVARVPVRFHQDICYSKCLKHAPCLYYHYDVTMRHCVMCIISNVSSNRVINLQIGSQIEVYSAMPYPDVVHSRINDCEQFDDTCNTRWFAGNGGLRYSINLWDLDTIEYCVHTNHASYVGGLRLTARSNNTQIFGGCMDQAHLIRDTRYVRTQHRDLLEVYVIYGDNLMGLGLRTSYGGGPDGSEPSFLEFFGDDVGSGTMCRLRGRGLVDGEVRAGALIDGIRFRFNECD